MSSIDTKGVKWFRLVELGIFYSLVGHEAINGDGIVQ
jgi:hypothetical protein